MRCSLKMGNEKEKGCDWLLLNLVLLRWRRFLSVYWLASPGLSISAWNTGGNAGKRGEELLFSFGMTSCY